MSRLVGIVARSAIAKLVQDVATRLLPWLLAKAFATKRGSKLWGMSRTLEVVVDFERICLPADAGSDQCIAELEEHWRSRKRQPPCAQEPKQFGPIG
jgi:hypothetical protein